MVPEIITKLTRLLKAGVADEPQAVYLMTAIRKILEQQGTKDLYHYLNFHCNWAVHSKLSGPAAQDILKLFDAANTHLKTGVKLHELPRPLQNEIEDISKMTHFEKELEAFLKANILPPIDAARSDGWTYFLHFYVAVIADCPLVISANNTASGIERVTVKVELANQPVENEMVFRVRWTILDKNGRTGSLEIYNSFSLNPDAVDA